MTGQPHSGRGRRERKFWTGVGILVLRISIVVVPMFFWLWPADVAGQARRAEVDRFIADVHGVVNREYRIGSEAEFWLWTDRGAITMVSVGWSRRGTERGAAVTLSNFERTLGPSFSGFVGVHERYLFLRLRRERTRWRAVAMMEVNPVDHPGLPADGAPEGRSIPLRASASRTPAIRQAMGDLARAVAKLAVVPAGGESQHRIVVAFEDERVSSWRPAGYSVIRSVSRGKSRGQTRKVDRSSAGMLAKALIPFARGLGAREVEVVLRGTHEAGRIAAGWHLVRARVVRERTDKDEFAAIVREYRQTHEKVIADWHGNLRSAALKTAGFTIEQVALWIVGGWLFKAAGAALRPLAPRLIGFLRGASKSRPTGAAEYMETLLTRLPGKERDAVRLLMGKAETQGMNALSSTERAQLQSLIQRLEGMVGKRLTRSEKQRLRNAMYSRFDDVYPGVSQAFERVGLFGTETPIHHRIPLEWAHRTPALDINGPTNLIMVHEGVHKGINAVWSRFRTAPANKVTEHHVKRVAGIVDTHFKQWYNKPPQAAGWQKSVESAKTAARAEVDALIATISR